MCETSHKTSSLGLLPHLGKKGSQAQSPESKGGFLGCGQISF